MRVLITGVPGWLGNRFLDILSRGFDGTGPVNNWKVRCLILPGTNLSDLKRQVFVQNVEFFEGDVTRPETLEKATQDVEVVFHAVGIIHPKKISELYQVNESGTRNMLKASARSGVKRFIYISSNSVAGINRDREILLKETDTPNPYFNYGKSKLAAEMAVNSFQKEKKLETVILRPCWYYGPNQPVRQTIFFQMIKRGNPLIFGDGSALRSMSYLDNTAQAMILAAQSAKAVGQTYWTADEKPYTADEIYRTVANLLGVKHFKPRYVPDWISESCILADWGLQSLGFYIKEIHVAGEMNKNIGCSIEKAQKELGYRPTIALEDGMRRSIEWCRRNGIDI